ncbi:MAG: hypothetical protein ACUVXA_04925 [Candidatus Jordarchaeum sp.]|uniref:hypothetical protein n=1 Tax=Candidatus Jordarchaeum sp. TaxID=2823881 RepID=UPI00404AD5FE
MSTERDENNLDYQKKIRKLQKKVRRLSWFPSYQSFSEIGIKGKRDDNARYRFMDLEKCRNKTVIDFGWNLGQTCLKAYKAGAKRVIGLDSQKDAIKLAREIANLSNTHIEFYIVDFNRRDYQQKILELLRGDRVDISFFLSMYRTRELKDRNGLFNFIVSLTSEVIFFEGHADPGLDTEKYYSELFRNFSVDYKFLGYTQGNSRPFYEVYPIK